MWMHQKVKVLRIQKKNGAVWPSTFEDKYANPSAANEFNSSK